MKRFLVCLMAADELQTVLGAVDVKKLYKLNPKLDEGACDASTRVLLVYGSNDEVLKRCGGYAPLNEKFVDMYLPTRKVVFEHAEDNARIKDAWLAEVDW